MTAPGEVSALRTWATVLAFLAGLLVVLGTVAYFTRVVAHARRPALAAQTEGRH